MANEPNAKHHADSAESIFPLPLSPLEKFFFWDDRPELPCTFFIEMRFASSLDVAVLEKCIARVVDRNPLLRANVTGDDRHLTWTLNDKPFALWDLADVPPIVNGVVRPIDLRTDVGCRFWCETTQVCSRVLVQLHHCVCDAIAFRTVVIDILHLYKLATGNELLSSQDRSLLYDRLNHSLLRERYNFEHLGKPKRETTTWQRIKNAWYFHFQPPVPLAKLPSNEPTCGAHEETQNPLCNMLMEREFSQRVLNACQSKAYGVNELAIALLFRTCYQWNRLHGDKRRNGRLRILMPCDLRGRADLRMPATNRLSLSFLGRDYSQCEDLKGLIDSVLAELKDAKETHLYLDLLKGLELGCRWPRLMKWALARSDSMATAVITYTGDVSRGLNKLFPEVNELRSVGSASLFAIAGAPPVRRNTNISLAICINWGRICISASWNRSVFTGQDCSEFLELYKSGWQQWCEAEESLRGVYAEPETV